MTEKPFVPAAGRDWLLPLYDPLTLAKRLNPAAQVIGIDPDSKALARARRKAQRAGVPVHFDSAYSQCLPFPDASFDTVLMLRHVHRDAKLLALREVRRVLKPGGSLHLADFDKGSSRGLHGMLASMLQSRGGSTRQPTVIPLMQDAGLGDAQEIVRRASVTGRIVYYRAVRTPSPTAA